MTRKDFELIADILRGAVPAWGPDITAEEFAGQRAQHEWTVTVFAHRLRATNPRFDVARFKAACGVTP